MSYGGSINIIGLDRAAILHGLYHGTRPLGLGKANDRPGFSLSEARELIELAESRQGPIYSFDYVCGRPIKVTFEGENLFRSAFYDRDAGHGACEAVIARLRAETETAREGR